MYCKKCGSKQDGDAVFCEKCGNKVISEKTNMSVSSKPTKSKTSSGVNEILTDEIMPKKKERQSVGLIPTTSGVRFGNYIIDNIFVIILGTIISALTQFTVQPSFIFVSVIQIVYYTFFESLWQKTPAKFITRTRVISDDGFKPDFFNILTRSASRCVPFDAFSFLGGDRPVGWHDRWSHTLVVSEKEVSEDEMEEVREYKEKRQAEESVITDEEVRRVAKDFNDGMFFYKGKTFKKEGDKIVALK